MAFAGVLLLAGLPADQGIPSRSVHLAMVPSASTSWLDRLNLWRAGSGVPAVTENTDWSAGDYDHAVYMVQTGQVTHYELTTYPQYTAAGNTAAQNSNIYVSSSTATTDSQAIDWWMGAPFHAMAMVDPRLAQTGFGSYRSSAYSSWQMGAAVNVGSGMTATGHYPVYFPGNGSSEPLTRYSGNEYPDPQLACPGYSGLPLFAEVGANVSTTAGSVHTLTGNGTPLPNCVIDSTNPTFAANLKWHGGVIVMPQQPLQANVTYAVALTVNGVPYTWSFTVGAFTPPAGWQSLGGELSSGPAASTWGTGRIDAFVRGSDQGLYWKSMQGGAWGSWIALGGVLTSNPAAVSWGANRIDTFVRGSDNQLYHKFWDGTQWSGWEALGGILTSGPTVASWSAGRLDVFVRGTDNALWHKFWDGTRWSAWESLGGILTADPAAVSWGPNRIDVLARGTDYGLWQRSWNGLGWSAWQPLGGVLNSAPAALSCLSGHLDAFVLGSDDAVYQLGYAGAWGTWRRLSGPWTTNPAAVCPQPGATVNLFERWSDAALWQTTVTGS